MPLSRVEGLSYNQRSKSLLLRIDKSTALEEVSALLQPPIADGTGILEAQSLHLAIGESFFEPEIYNLGPPFNTSFDDAYFNLCDSIGFISSNRNDAKHLNIYHFNVNNFRGHLRW